MIGNRPGRSVAIMCLRSAVRSLGEIIWNPILCVLVLPHMLFSWLYLTGGLVVMCDDLMPRRTSFRWP